jgi:hypothetical protein
MIPPGIGIIKSVAPSHIAPVANVTIKGGKPPLEIINPLIKPMVNPANKGTNSHNIRFIGVSGQGKLAAITLVILIIAPIERSIPPASITKVCANPAKIRGVILVKRFTLLFHVKKIGSITPAII